LPSLFLSNLDNLVRLNLENRFAATDSNTVRIPVHEFSLQLDSLSCARQRASDTVFASFLPAIAH
jgi:hypothetical protein